MQTNQRERKRQQQQHAKRWPQPIEAPADAGDDLVPRDMDQFRNELARRINRFIGDRKGYWRACRQRACRRHRACAAPHIHCSNAPPVRKVSPKRHARFMAQLQRALRERQEQQEAEA